MSKLTVVGTVAAMVLPVCAEAAEPRVLAPSSPWTLDFADERCSLIRDFADGDDTLRLQVDSYGTKSGYRVMISGNLVPASFNVPLLEIRPGYSPDRAERDRFYALAGPATRTRYRSGRPSCRKPHQARPRMRIAPGASSPAA